MEQVYFYYPSKILGGAELLFCRMAKELACSGEVKPIIIDERGGFLHKFATNENIDVYLLKENMVIENGCVVIPPSHIFELKKNIIVKGNAKILLWSMHPLNLESLHPLFPIIHRLPISIRAYLYKKFFCISTNKLSALTHSINQCRALVFMDETNVNSINTILNKTLEHVLYLPIPVNLPIERKDKKARFSEELTIAWLGRVADFKINSIIKIYHDLCDMTEKKHIKVNFKIIGNGAGLKKAHQVCIDTQYVSIEFVDTISSYELDNYLIKNVDLLIAMGTSCLEGAKLAIPSLLIDILPDNYGRDYKYRWIYETSGYSLGKYIEADEPLVGRTLESILVDSELNIEGRRGQDYVYDNHDIHVISKKLMSYIQSSNFNVNKFNVVLNSQSSILRTLFYVMKKIKRVMYVK